MNAEAEFDRLFQSAECATPDLYAEDCRFVVDHAQASERYFPGIVAFVALTIQQPFYKMPAFVPDVARYGVRSRYMPAGKAVAFEYARANKTALHLAARAFSSGESDLTALLLEYLRIPGIGLIKASFLAQLTVGDGACMDTVNLQRMGWSYDSLRMHKEKGLKHWHRRIENYNAAWRAQGDSAFWWQTWCEAVAGRTMVDTHKTDGAGRPILRRIQSFTDAAHVSRIHRLAITGGIS